MPAAVRHDRHRLDETWDRAAAGGPIHLVVIRVLDGERRPEEIAGRDLAAVELEP